MAGLGRPADATGSGAPAAGNRRRTRGPAVRPDRFGDAAAAGHVACRRRPHARARIRDQECKGGGAGDQFARRLAGAAAPDLPSHPATRGGKETAGAGVRRGRRGIRRLHARLRGRRDLLRSQFDPGFDRRGRRLLRISGVDQEGRHRAQALYRGRAQGDARSVPAGKPRRRRARQGASARDPRLFIALVKQSRGVRLKGADDVLFSGEYWAGETSVSLGLADAIGDLRSTLRARYGEKELTPVIAPATGLLSSLLGRKSGAGTLVQFDGIAGLPDEVISALETRAIWAKFGF